MAVITANAWEEDEGKSKVPDPVLFGHQDLASDYYQVLIQRERPRLCRLIWGVLILLLFGFTSFMVYKLLAAYFQYNSFNKSSVKWTTNVTLPAISICSTNYVNYTALSADLDQHPDLKVQFDDFMWALQTFEGHVAFADYIEDEVDSVIELSNWEAEEGSIVMRYGNYAEQLLRGYPPYKFARVHKDITNYRKTTLSTELGMCIELNDEGEMKQFVRGVSGGFSIDLDANVETYLKTTATKGFVVFIRDQDETVMLNQAGYVISPGTETFMKLSLSSVKRLGTPHGTCKNVKSAYSKNSDSIHYKTVRECVQDQIIDEMIEVCVCIPWYWADRMFQLDKTKELDAAMNTIISLNSEEGTEDETSDSGERRKRRAAKRTMRNIRSLGKQRQRNRRTADDSAEEPTPTVLYFDSIYEDYVCNFIEQQLCDAAINELLREQKGTLESCPEPCKFNEWQVEMSTTHFPPTENYYSEFMTWDSWKDPPPTFKYAQENMARLNIYYDDIKITIVEQEKAYEIQNFVAEFGGTVDLFIGFSFFTVFQLIEILIAVCVFRCCRKGAKEVSPSVVENVAIKRET